MINPLIDVFVQLVDLALKPVMLILKPVGALLGALFTIITPIIEAMGEFNPALMLLKLSLCNPMKTILKSLTRLMKD